MTGGTGSVPDIPKNRRGRSTRRPRPGQIEQLEEPRHGIEARKPGHSRRPFAGNEKTRSSLDASEFLFSCLQSISDADIDRSVRGPLPAAIINMVVTVPMMAVAMPVEATMPVMTTAVATMPAVATVTSMATVTVAASENLSRDDQGGSGQSQSCDTSRNDLLDPRHVPLRSWQREDRPAMIQPSEAECDMM